MRRHPLVVRRPWAARLFGPGLFGPGLFGPGLFGPGLFGLGLLVAACALGERGGPDASATVAITVATAAGDDLGFEPTEVSVPAGAPVQLTFRNVSSVAHNLVFTTGIAASTRTIVEPGHSDDLVLAPLARGTYRFVCTIHEGMAGALNATG